MIVVRLYRTLQRETRADRVNGGCGEMNVGGAGISEEYVEMRDKTHRGEGPPH